MVKVCHMTSAHLPEDVRIFRKECTSLAKAGYDVYLVERGESYEKNGVHIVGVGEISGGRLKRMTQGTRRVYQAALALDADIYHFHDPELLPWGMKLKRKGKKVIFDSHEIYAVQLRRKPYLPVWCSGLIARVYAVYERYAVKKLDGLVSPCTVQGKRLYGDVCRRVALVNNMTLLSEFYDRYDPAVEKYPRSVCCLGSLTPARAVTQLVQATHQAGGTLYLGGYISPEYLAQLESMPEYACVRFFGPMSREQILDTVQHCQLCATPGLNTQQYGMADNLATKAYEAMAMGLPVIVARSAYTTALLKERPFGLNVDAENVSEYADAIRYLLDNPEDAARMGQIGRQAVKEEFNWGVEEQKLFALYEEILKD